MLAAETSLGAGWQGETPLWFSILKKAEARTGGERLGPVGGRIVAAVLATSIECDPNSYRAVDPGRTPTLPATEPGEYALADVLQFATVG